MSVDSPSVGVGGKLREARERRGVSLRQIANSTKIAVSVLDALERNDISRLPGGIFGRAFVRSFASEVGLDPEATIQEFMAQFPQDSVTAGHPTSTQAEDHEAIESDRRTATTFVRLIALSIPIAIAMIYWGTSGSRDAPPAAEAKPAAARADAPPTPPAEPALAPAAEAPVVENPSVGDPSAGLKVTLSAIRECWVSVTVDGEKTLERLWQPGEQQTLDVHREVVLTVGDASAIALTLNGAPARPLGRNGQVVTARLNPANFKEYVATP